MVPLQTPRKEAYMNLIGCDFHTRYQEIASKNLKTGEVTKLRLDHTGEQVRTYYASLEKPVKVAIESTGYSLWFEQMLQELGHELIVGDAVKINAMKVNKQKYDRLDADHLLNLMIREEFPQIYWPSLQQRDQRALIWWRDRLVRIRTKVKNSLQAIALKYRQQLGRSLFTKSGLGKLKKLELPEQMTRQRSQGLELLAQLNEWIVKLEEEITRLAQENEPAKLMMTHPGVGAIIALAFVLVIGPTERFKREKQVPSYLGLVPQEKSSGGKQRFGPMTKRGNCLMRFLLVQAAHIAIKFDPELRSMYYRILHKKGPRKAKVAIARKLAIRLYIMLRDAIDYEEFCRRGQMAKGKLPAGRA